MIESFKNLRITPDPKPQLLDLSKTLNELESQHAARTLTPHSELISWQVLTNSVYQYLFHDLQKQLSYLIDCYPGKMVYMTSSVIAERGIECFVTQDLQGAFQVILRKQDPSAETCYELHQNGISPYNRVTPFLTRLKYLKAFENNGTDCILRDVNTIENDIKSLKCNKTIWFEAGKSQKLGIHRTCEGEYLAILDTEAKNERYLRLDTPDKVVLINYKGRFLEQGAVDFMLRMKKFREKDFKLVRPHALKKLIERNDQAAIYKFIRRSKGILDLLETGHALRIGKKESKLARTLQIVRGKGNEYMLMLDSKNKTASGSKNAVPYVNKKTNCSISPAWRIDLPEPEEWINKTVKNLLVADAEYESNLSQNLHMTMGDEVNVSFVGEQYTPLNNAKRSHFSKRVINNLHSMLQNGVFPLAQREQFIDVIIDEVFKMHARGFIHQDLKTENIFMHYDPQYGYIPKLADFSESIHLNDVRNRKIAAATFEYASPEIIMAYQDEKTCYHQYFHGPSSKVFRSYAHELVERNRSKLADTQKDYDRPHFANDIWALGIIVFELRYNCKPRLDNAMHTMLIEFDPLVRGLLTEEREKRLTISQAKELYAGIRSKTAKIS